MKVLSVVCARAGSKGLQNKCVAKIGDKMTIEYTIEYSLSLGENVKTVVSTDSQEIICYCKKNKIDYIARSPELSRDESKIDGVIEDALKSMGKDCDYCSLLYGNIPTRYPELFHAAIDFLKQNDDYDGAISMQSLDHFHPDWALDYNIDLVPNKKMLYYRRQSMPKKMSHDTHTLIFKKDGFMKRYNGSEAYESEYIYRIFGNKLKPILNDKLIVDIDTKKDLELARTLILSRSVNFCVT